VVRVDNKEVQRAVYELRRYTLGPTREQEPFDAAAKTNAMVGSRQLFGQFVVASATADGVLRAGRAPRR